MRAVAGPDQDGVAQRERALIEVLPREAGLEILRRDFLAWIEDAAPQRLDVEQEAWREEDRRTLDAEALQAIGRPDVGERRPVVEADLTVVGLVADLSAEMAERVHVGRSGRSRSSGTRHPDGAAAGAVRTAGRAAGHPRADDTARRQRDVGVAFVPKPDDLVHFNERQRLPDLLRTQEVAVAALVLGAPSGRVPGFARGGARVGWRGVVGRHGPPPHLAIGWVIGAFVGASERPVESLIRCYAAVTASPTARSA